ncbi:DUF1398 domain-containing protein [Arachidicoccus sp.]|uniref:DUF1398 domain-containing protein n=1 Tax=Arachidicoccus sp. TaxID=1872624 RepID=UPI003D1CAC00
MFTVDQIKQAHDKVKSGADFPAYIRDLKKLGVSYYVTFVSDGHTDYFDTNKNKAIAPAKYEPLPIAEKCDIERFKARLKAHQQGQSGYLTFIEECATFGVDKWATCMEKMTCTYYDKKENEILLEEIPL